MKNWERRFGIKVSFDPDVMGRQVRLRVQGVDFYTALTLLGTQTGTFWRPLNPTLIFVAPDTPEKRRLYAPEAQQVFPLTASVAPDEMTELLRVLRDITGATHIELDSRSRTITMRDTPARLALAGQLIHQLEKARGEVLLEMELLEVDRGTMQKLGITPPSSTSLILLTPNDVRSLASSTDLANLLTNAQSIFTGKGLLEHPAIRTVRWRTLHLPADSSKRQRGFFGFTLTSAQRAASASASARRQAGHLLCRRPLPRHVVAAFQQPRHEQQFHRCSGLCNISRNEFSCGP